MNVYVHQLARAMGDAGIAVDIFTREHPDTVNTIEQISPNVRVVHLPAGDPETPLEELYGQLPQFLAAMEDFQRENQIEYQAVHSHYWLSGWAGNAFSQSLGIPHVITFHTLSLIKMQSRAGELESYLRQQVEKELMAGAAKIVAFSPHERDAMSRLYGADTAKIELVPCGVDLTRFREAGSCRPDPKLISPSRLARRSGSPHIPRSL